MLGMLIHAVSFSAKQFDTCKLQLYHHGPEFSTTVSAPINVDFWPRQDLREGYKLRKHEHVVLRQHEAFFAQGM